jgi:hypothetical protein
MQKITIHIPTPCHESWDAMKPTATGRHCAACAKTVVDFTKKTDAEILRYLARASGELCGRVRAEQLARPLQPSIASNSSRWRAWRAAVIAVWGLRLGVKMEAMTQTPITQSPSQVRTNPSAIQSASIVKDSILVRGIVVDSATHEVLPGATVILKGTTRGTPTNYTGYFSLEIPSGEWQSTGHTLIISMVGCRSETMTLPSNNPTPIPLTIALAADTRLLGEMIVAGGYMPYPRPYPWHPRAFFNWLTRPFRTHAKDLFY